jgi:HPt (histidine-containing phosphotransfer) domain-containing protein
VLSQVFADDHSSQLDVLQKFVSQTADILADFETAYDQRNIEQISFTVHKLKSSARTVGANKLADLCFTLETASRNTDWVEIDSLADGMRPAVDSVKDYVEGFGSAI